MKNLTLMCFFLAFSTVVMAQSTRTVTPKTGVKSVQTTKPATTTTPEKTVYLEVQSIPAQDQNEQSATSTIRSRIAELEHKITAIKNGTLSDPQEGDKLPVYEAELTELNTILKNQK